MKKEIVRKVRMSGFKISHIAKEIGTSLTQLSLYLNDKRDLPVATEDRLKKFLSEKVR